MGLFETEELKHVFLGAFVCVKTPELDFTFCAFALLKNSRPTVNDLWLDSSSGERDYVAFRLSMIASFHHAPPMVASSVRFACWVAVVYD